MRQNDIRIKSAVVSLRLLLLLLLCLPPLLCVSGECANVSMKKEIIRSCVSPLFWSFGLVFGLFSFFLQKNEKKGTSLLHNCVDVGLCRRTFRERERERDEFNLSNSNNNNNNKRCFFLSLYSLLLV
jgi:hypothetical protein